MTELIVIGTSLGGLAALSEVLACLPRHFTCPVAIVQHRAAAAADGVLAALLQARTFLPVVEPDDKVPIRRGHIYLAPADYHLLVETDGTLSLSTDPPVHCARPSIDVLFESAAHVFGEALTAVVLTGASTDGADGVTAVRERGGYVVAQDPSTAESGVMPRAAIAAGVDLVLPLAEIGRHLGRIGCVDRAAS
jgi:two-component system chemotaxis response regulator CheB